MPPCRVSYPNAPVRIVLENVLSCERCEALLGSPSDQQSRSVRDHSRIGAHTAPRSSAVSTVAHRLRAVQARSFITHQCAADGFALGSSGSAQFPAAKLPGRLSLWGYLFGSTVGCSCAGYTAADRQPNRYRPASPSMRQPLQLHFKPPASPGRWRLTGRFNQPRPSYGVVPYCEWINDEDGDQIWLSPSLIPIREDL